MLAAAFGVLVTAVGAEAQAPGTVLLEELTWTEVRDAVRAGKTTVIIPAGGTEQNGPHMALGKHNARVKVLSQDIARQLGDALVAPVIAYVPEGGIAPPTAHMRYPGTITAPEDAFQKVLEFAARSFKLSELFFGFGPEAFAASIARFQHRRQTFGCRLRGGYAGRLHREAGERVAHFRIIGQRHDRHARL